MFLLTFLIFFFNDPATTEIYTLSLHDALPILPGLLISPYAKAGHIDHQTLSFDAYDKLIEGQGLRSEEHTSELQSPYDLVCRLLLEKKKKNLTPLQLINIIITMFTLSALSLTY